MGDGGEDMGDGGEDMGEGEEVWSPRTVRRRCGRAQPNNETIFQQKEDQAVLVALAKNHSAKE
ncbi:hypothetical protein Pyn_10443 [Prunus yedoensis var. nudiflora]|uniref:Uncharacterized protein n=1 Tax=Prunus yedoensis var. nudiflora TaxID=2094558 RepID=A0A314ZGW3_PRUYE|nr:hypothetical protein Pyn_10443 [Prunus yedoensis var. nudiflora]